MRLLRPKVQMTSGEFKTALRAAGFSVESGRLVDVSETCPGFATIPSLEATAPLTVTAPCRKSLWSVTPRLRGGLRSLPSAVGDGDLASYAGNSTVSEDECRNAMNHAFWQSCARLGLTGSTPVVELVGVRILELARDGEFDPNRLSEAVVATFDVQRRVPTLGGYYCHNK
jgi:hypothetical protein